MLLTEFHVLHFNFFFFFNVYQFFLTGALESNPSLVPCVDTMSYRPKNLEKGTGCSIWFIGLANSPLSFVSNGCYEFNFKTINAMDTFKEICKYFEIVRLLNYITIAIIAIWY